MPYATTELANLALSHFGATPVENIDTDQSAAGDACRVYFPVAFETFLEDWDWPFARKTAPLGLVAEDPTSEWKYAFRLPSNCRTPLRILSGQIIDDEDSEIPFCQGRDSGGGLIYTDKGPEAELEYTFLPEDVSSLPSLAILALSYKLAELMAGRIVREDPQGIAQRMERQYQLALDRAKAASLKSEKQPKPPTPKWLRSRR